MSIIFDKYSKQFWISCDSCSEQVDTDCDDFMEAVEFKKDNDWRSVRVDGEWEDRCPDCVEQNEEK